MQLLDKLSVGIIYTIKKSNGNKNAIIDYLCKETWSAREVYTDKVLLQCLRNTWCDLLDKVKYPSSLMREYYHVRDYPWNKDELEASVKGKYGIDCKKYFTITGIHYEYKNIHSIIEVYKSFQELKWNLNVIPSFFLSVSFLIYLY